VVTFHLAVKSASRTSAVKRRFTLNSPVSRFYGQGKEQLVNISRLIIADLNQPKFCGAIAAKLIRVA
jgi:hypothetical protein